MVGVVTVAFRRPHATPLGTESGSAFFWKLLRSLCAGRALLVFSESTSVNGRVPRLRDDLLAGAPVKMASTGATSATLQDRGQPPQGAGQQLSHSQILRSHTIFSRTRQNPSGMNRQELTPCRVYPQNALGLRLLGGGDGHEGAKSF